MLGLLALALEAWRLSQEFNQELPMGLSFAGFVQTHTCNFANTGGPDKRGGPGSCLSGQASPGPLSAGDPIQGAEWNNGFSIYGLITTLPFLRWNMIASYAPNWQTTGIWNEDPKIMLPPPSLELPSWFDPMVQAPFAPEPYPFTPPLAVVRARDAARAFEGDPTKWEIDVRRSRWEHVWVDGVPNIIYVPAPVAPPGKTRIPGVKGPGGGGPGKRPPQLPFIRWDEDTGNDLDGTPDVLDRDLEFIRIWPELDPFLRPDHDGLVHMGPRMAPGMPLGRVQVQPGEAVVTATGTKIQPSQHRSRRTRNRTKERKVIVTAGVVGKAFGKVTEFTDALDAVYDALPEAIRNREKWQRYGKDPRATVKLQLIWEHYDQLDVVKAVENLAYNQLEDWAIGQLSKRSQQALSDAGWQRPLGFQAGNTLGYVAEGFFGVKP